MRLHPLPNLIAVVGLVLLLATTEGYLLSLIFVVYGNCLLIYMLRDQFRVTA